jgi:hypothetical protein
LSQKRINVNKVLRDIARKMGNYELRVGYLENAKYDDGTPVAAVAFWNEYGHGGNFPSPPRPTFGPMVSKESPEWPATMAHLAKQKKFNGARTMAALGKIISEQLQDSIINTSVEPLSKTSLRLRAKFWGHPEDIRIRDVLAAQKAVRKNRKNIALASGTHAKPLLWTQTMLKSVDYEVEKK